MVFPFFKKKINKSLGIDIGTHSIKIVELEKDQKNNVVLSNYGMLQGKRLFQNIPENQQQFYNYNKNKIKFSTKIIVEALNLLLEKTKIDCESVVFSISDFHTFLNHFTLPVSEKEELNQMIPFEIQKYVPISYSNIEVDLLITPQSLPGKPLTEILFAATPKEIILQYKEIGKEMNFKFIEFEAEIFSLIRTLDLETEIKNLIVIIEIGVQSTTISIVEKGKLKISYSFNISTFEIDLLLVSSLKINFKEAEEFKKKYGIIGSPSLKEKNNENIIFPLINLILEKYKQTIGDFLKNRQDKVEKIYLSGGTASLPGLAEYFFYILKIPTVILNPLFKTIDKEYQKDYQSIAGNIGASYTIALGAALKKLKN